MCVCVLCEDEARFDDVLADDTQWGGRAGAPRPLPEGRTHGTLLHRDCIHCVVNRTCWTHSQLVHIATVDTRARALHSCVFHALIVHSELKSVHPGFPRNHENTMPETAFLGAQIAPKSLSAGASPPDPTGGAYSAPPGPLAGFKGPTPKAPTPKGRGGPRKIVHPEKFLRIGPATQLRLK